MNNIKEFIIKFFEKLGSKIKYLDDRMIISNIPENFQKFIGKSGDLKLSFGKEYSEFEKIDKESYLIKTMAEFLENKGQTSLIKLDFKDILEQKIKTGFILKNCEAVNESRNNSFIYLSSFYFQTISQYLDEKEQTINNIYVKNGEIIHFDIDRYKTIEGSKKEVSYKNTKQDYEIAKNHLKELINKKLEKQSEKLNKKLDKELQRIDKHYENLEKEEQTKIKKVEKQISELTKGLIQSLDKNASEKKIEKLKETLVDLKDKSKKEKVLKEKEFFKKDEIQKHSINLSNKLISTSLIYYPYYTFSFYLKNKLAARKVDLDFDPIKKSLEKIKCDSCKKEINEVYICNSGHIVCNKCGDYCQSCKEVICPNCSIKLCEICGKKICKKCSTKCSGCWKIICTSHLKENALTEKPQCINCLRQCDTCHLFYPKDKFPNNTSKCEKCSRIENLKKELNKSK